MELGVHSCIDKLGGPGERDPGMKNIDVATKVNDDEACRVLHITKAFQTSLGLRRCRKLTQRTFDEIGHLPILRTLDLLQTSIKTVAPLQHCHQLLSINLRYCAVQVRFMHYDPRLVFSFTHRDARMRRTCAHSQRFPSSTFWISVQPPFTPWSP